MTLEFFTFWMRETLSNISRNRLMSLLAVTTVAIALCILGSFYLALSNLSAAVANQTRKIDIVVMMQPNVSARRRKMIYNAAHIHQVRDLRFVSKGQVLREMQHDMPDLPISDYATDNPLGDELRIQLKNPEDVFKVRAYLNSLPGVQKTPNDDDPVRNLLAINRYLRFLGLAALLVLGMAILLIIHNAIRLTIFARRREIRIMELVGATSAFISLPFLLEGGIYGIAGALIASLVLGPTFIAATRSSVPLVQDLLPLGHSALLAECIAGMLLAGLAFGLVGSWISLARSLGKAVHL